MGSKRMRLDDINDIPDDRFRHNSSRSRSPEHSLPNIELPKRNSLKMQVPNSLPTNNIGGPRGPRANVRDPRVRVKQEAQVERPRDPRANSTYINRKNPSSSGREQGQKRKMSLQTYLSVKSEADQNSENKENLSQKSSEEEDLENNNQDDSQNMTTFNFRPFGT